MWRAVRRRAPTPRRRVVTAEFGRDRVFMDVDSIPLGSDFVEALRQQVANCAILLALIGPDWIDARDSKGLRRLDDPGDLVRLEIRSALERRIPVIPIAVGGFSFPLSEQDLPEDVRVLRYRQGLEVRNNSFSSDMALLVGRLRGLMERPVRSPRRTSGPTAPSYAGRGRKVAKVAKFSLMIFWHASGLRERDARRMQSNLAKRIAADVAKHYNKNAPDAFIVRYERTYGPCATCFRRFPILHSTSSPTTTRAKSAAGRQNTT
jgi:hypothetical protein